MSEDVAEPKRRGGWPKGKPRIKSPSIVPDEAPPAGIGHNSGLQVKAKPSLISKMKATPNWESEDFVGPDYESVDRLNIPRELVDALWRDGVALEWGTASLRGQDQPRLMSQASRRGWTVVHNGDFDGVLDGLFVPKGSTEPITVDDAILYARPREVHIRARHMERATANRPLQVAEEQIGHGIPGVTGSNHPTAIAQNKIKKTIERVEIPE